MNSLIPTMRLPLDNLPADVRREYSGKRLVVRIRPGLRAALRSHRRIPVSEWSQKRRVMGSEESFEGKWNPEFAPHAVKVMDMWAMPWVRELWFCGPDQASKTNSMLSCLGWSIEIDPDNVYYTGPTEEKTRELMTGKLIPMLHNSPALRRFVSRYDDDTTGKQVKLTNGVTIRAAWAGSASSTSAFSARYTFNDEIDKWDATGKEASAILRIKKRSKNFQFNHKHFFASTTGGRFIYKGTMSCQQVFEYAGRCPDCGELVVMDEDHLIIPEAVTVDEIKEHPERIGYACNHCGSIWNEDKRLIAFRTGDWLCIKGSHVIKPVDIGVHMTGFVTPDMPMASIACTIIKARGGDRDSLIDLSHGIKCIDFEEEQKAAVTESALLRFRSDLPRNLVPHDTARLVLLADTQQDSFYYQVWALGYAPGISMQMIRHGQVMRFEDLEGLLLADWHDHEGKLYRITGGLIDSGGTRKGYQKHSRTMEVYEWCSRNRTMLPHKGMHGRTGDLISYKSVATFPGTNKAIPGGLTRANLRVDLFKDELERLLALETDDAGALQFHCEIDESFAKHFTAEIKDEKGDWVHHKGKGRNDYFDCTVYALAYREMIKLLPDMRRPGAAPEHKATAKTTTTDRRRW